MSFDEFLKEQRDYSGSSRTYKGNKRYINKKKKNEDDIDDEETEDENDNDDSSKNEYASTKRTK